MVKNKSFNQFVILCCSLFILVGSNLYIQNIDKNTVYKTESEKNITIRYEIIKFLNVGNNRLSSTLLWITTLLFSDTEREGQGKASWMYYRFFTISKLDPLFFENYLFGGIYLSIIKDDVFSASKIYDSGLLIYPDSYQLLYNAAFNYYFEIGDSLQAIPLYKRLISLPEAKSNRTLPHLVSKILANQGDKEDAFKLLYQSYRYLKESSIKTRTKLSSYSLRAEIDLNCLNSGKNTCNPLDFYGQNYILESGRYRAQTKWRPFKIGTRSLDRLKTKRDKLKPIPLIR